MDFPNRKICILPVPFHLVFQQAFEMTLMGQLEVGLKLQGKMVGPTPLLI
jgi:hypothetical protein